jgi:hypothetical protein
VDIRKIVCGVVVESSSHNVDKMMTNKTLWTNRQFMHISPLGYPHTSFWWTRLFITPQNGYPHMHRAYYFGYLTTLRFITISTVSKLNLKSCAQQKATRIAISYQSKEEP